MNSPSNDPSGFPPRTDEFGASVDAPPPSNRSRWGVRILFVLIVVILLGVLAYNEAPREVARLYQAQAIEERYKFNADRALELVNKALEWNDKDPELYLLRARVQVDRQAYQEALDDVDQAIELGILDQVNTYLFRSELHQHLDRTEEALEDWSLAARPAREIQVFSPAQWRNGTAYVRAVGDHEVETALKDVESAMDLIGGEFHMAHRGGVLLYKLDRNEQAIRLLSQAIEIAEQENKRNAKRLETAESSQEFLGELLDVAPFEQRAESSTTTLARMHCYRSLAHEAAGNAEEAEADRKQAGDKSDQESWKARLDTLKEDDLLDLGDSAMHFAAFIDTRGYVQYRRGEYESALRDLTTAVDLAEAREYLLWNSPMSLSSLGNSNSPEEARYKRRMESDKTLAVLHYHRALTLEELGRDDEAKAELERVRELGFEPGPHLF